MTEQNQLPESVPETNPEESSSAAASGRGPGPSLAGRIGRVLLRLLVVFILGAALGAGIYYGAIKLYRDAIEPLRTLDTRLEDLQFQLDHQAANQQDQMVELRTRLTELEGRAAAINEQLSELEARVGVQQDDLGALQSQVGDLTQFERRLNALVDDQEALTTRMQELEDLVAGGDLPAERIDRNLQLLRAMTIMTRARVSLNDLNLGLAQADLGAASDILAILTAGSTGQAEGDSAAEPGLVEASDHLSAALSNVLSRPAVAEEELEIAWKLLIEFTSSTLEPSVDAVTE